MGAPSDEVAFAREGRREDQLAPAGGGVELLVQGFEADAALLEQGDGVDEMPRERPSRPSRQTTRVSPGRAKSSASSNPGRLVWEPEAVSKKIGWQPVWGRASC
jgi:hypothetical protein